MAAIEPLLLPEILISISKHLHQRDIVICLRVCKTWHELLVPQVWNRIVVTGRRAIQPSKDPSVEDLHRHRKWVRSLDIFHGNFSSFSTTFPNLHTLVLASLQVGIFIRPECDPSDLIACNLSIANLSLNRLDAFLAAPFWSLISGLPYLTSLSIQYSAISDMDDIKAFWSACLKLQSLRLTMTSIPLSVHILNRHKFPRLELLELDLIREQSYMEQLNFIRRCPNLGELLWNHPPRTGIPDVFAQGIVQGLWPNLEKLSLGHCNLDDDSSKVLAGMRRINKLDMTCTGFGPRCFQALQSHFKTLTELFLYKCPGATSTVLHEVMCSCPQLEDIQGDFIKAKDIVANGSWVCCSLKRLNVCILFDKAEYNLHPVIFERLSALTRLEKLHLGDFANGEARLLQETLDLRLRSGLGKLSTLRSLRSVNVFFSTQALELEDIQWMVGNWRQLEELIGILNLDLDTFGSLIEPLQANRVRHSRHNKSRSRT